VCWKFQQSRVIVCAVITFWAQCTESFLFNLYPYWAHFWTDSMNEIIHISAENCFIVTNSKVNRSIQRYPFTEEIIVFIKPDIFVSEWSKEGADSIYTPCITSSRHISWTCYEIILSVFCTIPEKGIYNFFPFERLKNYIKMSITI